MWPVSDVWGQLIAGDHHVRTIGSAQYGGAVTVPSLPIVGGRYRQEFDGQRVRTTVSLTVQATTDGPDACEGDLVPAALTDPLAPFGQQVVLRSDVGYGALVSEGVPLGTFRVEPVKATGGWRAVDKADRRIWLPAGGTLEFDAVDLWQQVVDSEFTGPVQPLTGGTIRSEVSRVVSGLVRVDTGSLPTTAVSGKSTVYQDSRAEAVEMLADLAGLVPMMGRDGLLTFVSPTGGANVWDVQVATDLGSPADLSLDPSGIVNVVVATGETATDDTATVRAAAYLSQGPLAWNGPLGPRRLSYSSPLLTTYASAKSAAETVLARRRAAQEVTFTVVAAFNPALDVLDKVTVTIRPGGAKPLAVTATVTGIDFDLAGGPMTLTCTCPREELL